MNVIIVEDEATAIHKLELLLGRINPEINVIARLNTVRDTADWIRQHDQPEIGFFDIQLSDDLSFEIFQQCQVNFPVIFITAYDDYLLKAFELNSIHYLLKPVNEDKLRQAIKKFNNLKEHFIHQRVKDLLSGYPISNPSKRKIIAKKGVDYIPVDINDVAYFFSEHKMSFLKRKTGELLTIDQTLMELEEMLDSTTFFRANRQYIVHINSIVKFRSGDQSKLELEVLPSTPEKIKVAKERAREFKEWINRR